MSHTCRTCDFSKFPITQKAGGPLVYPKGSIPTTLIYKLLQAPTDHNSTTSVATLSYYILKERVKAREVFSEKTSTGFFLIIRQIVFNTSKHTVNLLQEYDIFCTKHFSIRT